MKKEISITEALNEAWSIMLAKFPSILLLFLVSFLILFGVALILGFYSQLLAYPLLGSYLGSFLSREIVGTFFTIAIATISLKLADQQNIGTRDLFSRQSLFFYVLAADIIYLLLVCIGLLFFIIPGIFFALRLCLYDLYIVDLGLGPIEALKKSWKTLQGFTWRWLGFAILSALILLLGLLFFGIGLLFAWPTTFIARALLYRKLSIFPHDQKQEGEPHPPATT